MGRRQLVRCGPAFPLGIAAGKPGPQEIPRPEIRALVVAGVAAIVAAGVVAGVIAGVRSRIRDRKSGAVLG